MKWLLRYSHVSEVIDSDLPTAKVVAVAVIKGKGPADNVHLSGYWSEANPLQGVVSLEPANNDTWAPADGLELELPPAVAEVVEKVLDTVGVPPSSPIVSDALVFPLPIVSDAPSAPAPEA